MNHKQSTMWQRGQMVLESKEMCDVRHELIRIFNDLSLPMQKHLLAIAEIIAATREVILSESEERRKP